MATIPVPLTARDLILRRLFVARAQVDMLEELLDALDAEQPSADELTPGGA